MAERQLLSLEDVANTITSGDYKKGSVVEFGGKKRGVQFDGEDYVLRGKKDRQITESGINYLIKALGLPPALPKKIDADILAYVINTKASRTSASLSPILSGRKIVSFVGSGTTLISNEEIVDSIGRTMREPQFDKVYQGEDGNLSLTVVSEGKKQMSVTKGDKFVSGVRIVNNPMASKSTSIESYIERLVCLNGAIVPQAIWRAPNVINGDTDMWLDQNMESAIKETRTMFKSIKGLREHRIDGNLTDFLANLYEDLKVPVSIRDTITRRAIDKGTDNLYDLFNHITYVASNYKKVRDSDDFSARIMRISGYLANNGSDICAQCNRPQFAQ